MGTSANASAETISLPQGGGALQGIGETFSPDPHTGTGSFAVPLAIPPGRNGFGPKLTLAYSTGAGNGPFGLGWSLGVPMISRKTSAGVPRYGEDLRRPDVFVLSGAEDLVPVDGAPEGARRYRPRVEGLFAEIDYHAATDTWEVRSKDGLINRFGGEMLSGGRAVVADPLREGRTFSWLLTETIDPFGNRIRYEYLRDRSADPKRAWD
ncbi:MAG TPA: SpvB/TcaC N-terminal domain-containing protein, partial [Longimicrobium sp.]|nr:SpvB/TcaC N-terminal domain-containing protein [Longimicrobium sp.]